MPRQRHALWIAVLLWVPYMAVWLSPLLFAPDSHVATGFPQYDQAYYFANGRAVFERGNGLLGPNPFDPDLAAPAIYFHWLTWLFGALTVFGRLDPGVVYVGVGALAGVAFSRLTLALVARLSNGSPRSPWLAALAMWGGGVAFLAHAGHAALRGESGLAEPTALQPNEGWWFLPWGPNVLYTTEAVYHVLVLGVWLAWLARRWTWMLVCAAAIASTHPFTGAQTLAWLGAWLALNQVAPARTGVQRVPLVHCAAFGALCAAFAAYYFAYLPSFPQHIALTKAWSFAWQEKPIETLVAYAPVAALAVCAWLSRATLPRPEAVFFAVVAAVSFALAHYHWIAPSHQPLHFTHGYLWIALFALGVPLLDALLARALSVETRSATTYAALAALLVLASADNLALVLKEAHAWDRPSVTVIDREVQALFGRVDREHLRGVLLSNDMTVAYLAATYTSLRPYVGHRYSSPRVRERIAQVLQLFDAGRAASWFEPVDVLIVRGRLPTGDRTWAPVQLGQRWSLYRRAQR